MYRYCSFGCEVDSELECPELGLASSCITKPDVQIRFGHVPDRIADCALDDGFSQVGPDVYLLRLEGIANFCVSNGCEIVIERCESCPIQLVRLYLLSQCFGALLHQRGCLILHASSVVTSRGALVFMGPSGVGKSSMAAAFVGRGYKLLAEDLCALSCSNGGGKQVLPGLRQIRLWSDSVEQFAYDKKAMDRVWDREDKYSTLLVEEASRESAGVLAIYALVPSAAGSVAVERMSSSSAVTALVKNTFRMEYLRALGRQESHFRQVVALAGSVDVKTLTRPIDRFAVDEQIDLIENENAFQPV